MISGQRKWSRKHASDFLSRIKKINKGWLHNSSCTRHLVLVSTLPRMASKHHQSNHRFGSSVAEDRQNRFSAGFFKIIDEVILGFLTSILEVLNNMHFLDKRIRCSTASPW